MADSEKPNTEKVKKITRNLVNKEETDNILTISLSASSGQSSAPTPTTIPAQSVTPIPAIPGQPSAPIPEHSLTSTPATSSGHSPAPMPEHSPAPAQLEPKDIDTLKFQVLMKEIDIRSAEINARIPSQVQTITTLATLSGGFAALAGFLFGAAHVSFIPWGPVICLIYSFIVLTFAWTNLDHDIQMADIGNYLEDDVRKQLRTLLKMEEKQQKEFFSWGNYRINKSIRRQYARGGKPIIRFSSYISSVSRYGSMIALAVISDIIAIYGVLSSNQGFYHIWIIPVLPIINPGGEWVIIVIGILILIYGGLLWCFARNFRNKVVEIKARIFELEPPKYYKILQKYVAKELGLRVKEIKKRMKHLSSHYQDIVSIAQDKGKKQADLKVIRISALKQGHKWLVDKKILTQSQSDIKIEEIEKDKIEEIIEEETIKDITSWFLEY